MTYKNIIEKLKHFDKIVVTGPQRSGTTIASKMIHEDLKYLNYIHKDERHVSGHSWDLALYHLAMPYKTILQCPGLSSRCHLFPKEYAIVFMIRNTMDIIKSQLRINWRYEPLEWGMYYMVFGPSNTKEPICEYKYDIWKKIQKDLVSSCFELEFESLKAHPLWKDNRKHFKAKQTE